MMQQKLSAMRYIKNNKKRVAVLIVSLSLSFVLTYLTQFLLSTTEKSFQSFFEKNTKKIQFIELAGSSYGLDVERLSTEELLPLYNQKVQELMESLREYDGIKKVYLAEILYAIVRPAIGTIKYEMPLVDKEEIPMLLEHFGAVLKEGRLPEHDGELVLDEATMKNNGYVLDGYFDEENCKDMYQIVGVLDYDGYFGCGIPNEANRRPEMIAVLSEGIDDFSAVLAQEGIIIRDTYDTVLDYKWGVEFMEKEISGPIGESTEYIFIGISFLLSISLFIVYTTYLRDRREEWCLYCSIGYSRRTIYFSILRELLFTFVTALLIGAVLLAALEGILYAVMIEPKGLQCRFFHAKVLGEILCTYGLLLGILQISVRYALFKIRTIDAIDEELI